MSLKKSRKITGIVAHFADITMTRKIAKNSAPVGMDANGTGRQLMNAEIAAARNLKTLRRRPMPNANEPKVTDELMHDVVFLRESLRRYGRHLSGCAAVREMLADEDTACDCGFGAIEVRL